MVRVDYDLDFNYREYANQRGPFLPITLIGPTGKVDTLALVDSGAQGTLFQGQLASIIGVQLLEGGPEIFSGLGGGSVNARMHKISVEINGYTIDVEAGFSMDPIARNLLGATFLEHVQFGVRKKHEKFFIATSP